MTFYIEVHYCSTRLVVCAEFPANFPWILLLISDAVTCRKMQYERRRLQTSFGKDGRFMCSTPWNNSPHFAKPFRDTRVCRVDQFWDSSGVWDFETPLTSCVQWPVNVPLFSADFAVKMLFTNHARVRFRMWNALVQCCTLRIVYASQTCLFFHETGLSP